VAVGGFVACQHWAVLTRPRVVAHRGASEIEAEHTLAAYHRAVDDGADGVECDVRLTRDGVLVCVHDRRIDRTSSGRGIVSALELSDLSDLDFGSWHYAAGAEGNTGRDEHEAPDRDRSGVLTLSRLLEAAVDRGQPLELAIETKHPTRYAGLVEIALVELLARFGLDHPGPDDPVQPRVMSFAFSSLRRLRAMAPALPTVFLMDRVPLRYRDGSLPSFADAAGPAVRILRTHPSYVEKVHQAGGEVHVWTVDDPGDVELMCELGVDVIITNRPGAVLAQLADLAPRC
jgi:glycerophosphoryl diester phosphodiesterase